MDYPVKSFRQFVTEDQSAVANDLSSIEALSGGGAAGAQNPYNQFAYFQDPSMMGGQGGAASDYDARMLAAAAARRREMNRRFGRHVTSGALRRAETSIGSDTGWAPVYHALGRQRAEDQGYDDNWYIDYQLGGRENRAAYNRTLGRMDQAYRSQGQTPGRAIPKGGRGAGSTTTDRERKGR